MRISWLMAFAPLLVAPALAAGIDIAKLGGVKLIVPDVRHWEQTVATGMADVAIAQSGTIWVVGKNGTIWHSYDGTVFTEEDKVSGFGRIAAGENDNEVYAVGHDNHTLWHSLGAGKWVQTPASDVADVAVDSFGDVWIVGTNGTIWRGSNQGQYFSQVKAEGFCRIGTHSHTLWAVGCNGTLWRYHRPPRGPDQAWDAGEWIRTDASGIADVTGDEMDSNWVVGKNGSVWRWINGPIIIGEPPQGFVEISRPASFVSIATGYNRLYAVRGDGTLWRYKP